MLRSQAHPDRPSRAVGLCAFFVGIAMLAAVFLVAYQLFTHPVPGLNLSDPPQGPPPPAGNIGVSLAGFLEKLLLLALLTLVGSLVASRGVHLCFAAHGPGTDTVAVSAPASKNGHAALPVSTPAALGEEAPPAG